MSTRARTQQPAAPAPTPVPATAPEVIDLDAIPDVEVGTDPISISDDDDNPFESDEEDFYDTRRHESESSVEGNPDVYYGGYGVCNNCGKESSLQCSQAVVV
jgi:hypothetical protein